MLPKLLRRPQKKLANLRRTLIVSPVADPNNVAVFVYVGLGPEHRGIRCLMQSPCVLNIKAFTVNRPQRLAECEHAVKPVRSKQADLLWSGRGSVVSVMEHQSKTKLISQPEQTLCKLRRIPFVQNNDFCVSQSRAPSRRSTCTCQIQSAIGAYIQIWINLVKLSKRWFAARFTAEILDRPAVFRLEYLQIMSALTQASKQTAEEVRVAVVPIGTNGMSEIGDPEFTRHDW